MFYIYTLIVLQCNIPCLTQYDFYEWQNASDLMREIEALGDELKKSREEVGKNHAEVNTSNYKYITLVCT